MKKSGNKSGHKKSADSVSREPYEPPRIISREHLEAQAGFCDPAGSGKEPDVCDIGAS